MNYTLFAYFLLEETQLFYLYYTKRIVYILSISLQVLVIIGN